MKNTISIVKKMCGIKSKESEDKKETEVSLIMNEPKEEKRTVKPVRDLLSIITEHVEGQVLTIQLNKNEMDFLDRIIKNNPVFFKDIHEEIEKIVKDGVLNVHNIPEMVLLLSQIFHIHFIEKKIEEIGMMNIIQFIFDCILESGIFHTNHVDIEILKKVVKISLTLLEMNVTIERDIVCCKGIMGFFSKNKV